MNTKTVSHGRKTIVFGMSWFVVSDDEQPEKTAAEFSKRSSERTDLTVIRKGEFQQFALASTSSGAKSGAVSAAAMVANLCGADSWIYVLEIGQSIWIGAGRDGYILAEGDRVFDDQAEARAAFSALMPATYKNVYLPQSWAQSSLRAGAADDSSRGTEKTDLRDFLFYEAPAWGKLKSGSSAPPALKIALAAALLLGGSFFGYGFIFSGSDTSQAEIDAAMQMMAQEQKNARDAEIAALDGNHPWASAPHAAPFLESCIAEMRAMPATAPGFELGTIACQSGNVSATFQRDGGYVSWFTEWATKLGDYEVIPDLSGENAVLARSFAPAQPRADHDLDPAHDYRSIASRLLSIGQIMNATIQMDQPIPPQFPENPEYIPIYAETRFTLTTKDPVALVPEFANFSGFTINSVTLAAADQAYTIEGNLYVPNSR